MASEIEYALMAGRAYQENRAGINHFPVLSGWLPKNAKGVRLELFSTRKPISTTSGTECMTR
ncbi:MAG: hypothetical protein KIT42_09525 [Rhodocyclaceae bacterium]|nr:hypothetical protein [Zoogloeaceae bacterium]MCW5596095.1 hypothetical protein [Rhodocyclaceae bacterium]